jgi:hypothetical protein
MPALIIRLDFGGAGLGCSGQGALCRPTSLARSDQSALRLHYGSQRFDSCAERSQRIQISRRVVTDQIDRPCAKQHEGRRNGDDGGTDHGGASAILEITAA